MGVGVSDLTFQGSMSSCGRCIRIDSIQNLANLNWELNKTIITEEKSPSLWKVPFTVMTMDQCTDPICMTSPQFLDLDVYTETPPSIHGNPFGVSWTFVDCPVYDHETISFLIETDRMPPVYFFLLYPRNHRRPIQSIVVDGSIQLTDQNGWRFDLPSGWTFPKNDSIRIRVNDQYEDTLRWSDVTKSPTPPHLFSWTSSLQN